MEFKAGGLTYEFDAAELIFVGEKGHPVISPTVDAPYVSAARVFLNVP
jgi:hypothetical protein